jgi:D-alanyl-D-alanine dipeptidase
MMASEINTIYTPLVEVQVKSIYRGKDKELHIDLPKRLALATPDMARSIELLQDEMAIQCGYLVLSDMYRSYDMQLQAHLDFRNKKKTAFSPPPGGSFHEAGRAIDISIADLGMTLAQFWGVSKRFGFSPVIHEPVATMSEAWHFDNLGSHKVVLNYYGRLEKKKIKSYTAAAISGILAIGQGVDVFSKCKDEATLQFFLIRCGCHLGEVDGKIGNATIKALESLEIKHESVQESLVKVAEILKTKFPDEYVVGKDVVIAG